MVFLYSEWQAQQGYTRHGRIRTCLKNIDDLQYGNTLVNIHM